MFFNFKSFRFHPDLRGLMNPQIPIRFYHSKQSEFCSVDLRCVYEFYKFWERDGSKGMEATFGFLQIFRGPWGRLVDLLPPFSSEA